MRDLPNIEPSGFTHGAYVGYAAGTVWSITKSSSSYGRWLAIPRLRGSAELDARRLYAFTLTDMSAQLAALQVPGYMSAGAVLLQDACARAQERGCQIIEGQ